MAVAIEMPKPGVTVEECLLVKWLKREADPVSAGDIVAEIETDKATFEVNAPVEGIVLATFFAEGALVPVYANICVIGASGEDIERFRPSRSSEVPAPEQPKPVPVSGEPLPRPDTAPAPSVPGAAAGHASPRARRFAAEHRVSLAGVAGSGPGGRILESDVRDAWYSRDLRRIAAAPAPAGAQSRPASLPRPAGIREKIARRMRESLSTTAQYTLHTSADATELLAVRAGMKAAQRAVDVNINELVMFCTVKALAQVPELNAEYVDGELRRHAETHLGFACDTPRGLLVPVVRNAHQMPLDIFAAAVKKLTLQAIEGRISPDDLTGATFTVSNLGNLGIESFTPILNVPQVGILGVDAIELRPERRAGEVVFVDRIGLSLTLDHQVIDGAPGARFLKVLRDCLENVRTLASWSEQ